MNVNKHSTLYQAGMILADKETPSSMQRPTQPPGTMVQGTVRRVHSDTNQIDVTLNIGGTAQPDISIAYPYVGPAGMMGVCPEVGSSVLLMETAWGLVPVAYKVPDPQHALDFSMQSTIPDDVSDPILDIYRKTPAAFRLLRPGEGRMASAHGGEVFLDEDVEIKDVNGNTITIRSGDGSTIATSQQNYMFASGVWRSAGPIQRNSLITKQNGVDIPGYVAQNITGADGKRVVYIGGEYGYGAKLYNEYRIEVDDTSTLDQPINDVNSNTNITPRTPTVIQVMGNYVGNDSKNDPDSYGKFIAPDLVTGVKGQGRLNFKYLLPNGSYDTLGKRGVAWGYHVPNKSFVGVDKSGAHHAYYGSMGDTDAGVSETVVGRGGRREEWGVIRAGNVSWDLYCKGALRWDIGKGSEDVNKNVLPRSLEVFYRGGTYTEHGTTATFDSSVLLDGDGNELPYAKKVSYRRVERVYGNSRDEVSGNSDEFIGASKTLEVGSSYTVNVDGSYSESTIGDRTLGTNQALSINAASIKTIAQKRTEKFTLGSDEKMILTGNDMTTIVTGNHITNITTGNQLTNIGAGNISTVVAAGNMADTLSAGNYALTVNGNTAMTSSGVFTIGGTSVMVNGATAISLTAPSVTLGLLPTLSGVITMLSHRDYVTGAPLMPSLTVLAST